MYNFIDDTNREQVRAATFIILDVFEKQGIMPFNALYAFGLCMEGLVKTQRHMFPPQFAKFDDATLLHAMIEMAREQSKIVDLMQNPKGQA